MNRDLLIGGISGIVSRTTTAPLELWKIQQQNYTLKNEMGVGGFPTVWFVNPEITAGKVTLKKLGKLGTSRNVTVKTWLENANKILKNK